MTAGNAATPVSTTRLVSPVLITMLVLSAIGAWNLWQDNAGIAATLGTTTLVILGAWILYGAIAVLIVVALQRFARRPAWSVVVALLWGGSAVFWVASVSGLAMSTIFVRTIGSDPHAFTSTPVIEEVSKALGVLGLLLIPVLRRFRTLDGLFYGVLVGAAFQVIEDAFYTLTLVFNDPGNAEGTIVATLVLRGFTIGLFTHAVFTGIVVAAIGWAASGPAGSGLRRGVGAVVVLVAMILVHGTFNAQDDLTIISAGAALIPFIVLLIVMWQARRGEVAHLAEAAAAANGWDVLDEPSRALIDGPRPSDGAVRRTRGGVRRFAWAADHIGPESSQARRAAAALQDG